MADVWLNLTNRFVEKLFNVKGGPTVVDINPSVQVTLQLDADNEIRYLEGWNRYGVNVAVGAVAAQFGTVQIRNPAGSNVIAVVESLRFNPAAADSPTLTWGATVTDLATLASLTFTRIDPRGNPQPTCIISSTTTTANLAVFAQFNTSTISVEFIPTPHCEYTVLPGQILKVFGGVANQIINVSWLWRERVMETSELT